MMKFCFVFCVFFFVIKRFARVHQLRRSRPRARLSAMLLRSRSRGEVWKISLNQSSSGDPCLDTITPGPVSLLSR